MFANCIPLVLKFLNQNICQFVGSKNTISVIDFPVCVIGEQPELTTENLDVSGDQQVYCWRNLFSCINLLRVLNKLTKWKHSRIMMLVVFKSAPILKKSLKLRQPMLQLYILKLLKIQVGSSCLVSSPVTDALLATPPSGQVPGSPVAQVQHEDHVSHLPEGAPPSDG